MKKNRKRYTRNLELRTILLVLVFGIIGTSLGCGFVHLRTSRVTNGDQKRALEREILSLGKEIDTLALHVAQATDREALLMRLHMEGSELVQIENQYRTLRGVAFERVAMRGDVPESLGGR
jgi:hypothetical protein